MLLDKFNNRFKLTENIIIYSLPIIAVTGLLLPLLFGEFHLSLLGSYLAVPMILAPIIFIKHRYAKAFELNININYFLLLVIIFFLCFAASMVLLKMFYVRPLVYFILTSIMFTSIMLQIALFKEEKVSWMILLQIVIITLMVIWGVNLKYYFFIGRTDPIVHAWYIQSLIEKGHITEVFENYQSFPLWHIMCSFLSILFGMDVPVHKVMYFTGGIIYCALVLTVYLISRKIFKDDAIALLISLLICLNIDFITYGMSSIARSVESFFGIILILLLITSKTNYVKRILLLFFTFIVVVYHPVSIPFILLIFITIYIISCIYKVNKEINFINVNYLIYVVSITLTYWMYRANYLLQDVVGYVINPAKMGVKTKSIYLMPFNELFNYLQYIPMVFFIIYGFLWSMNSKKCSTLTKILCLFGLISVSLAFPGPSLLISKLSDNFNLLRFGEYSFFFTSFVAAVGLLGLFKMTQTWGKIIIIAVFFCMTFLTLTNDFTASDNPLIKRPFYTYYLTEEEVNTINNIASITEGYIFSDFIITKYIYYSPYSSQSHILEVNTLNDKLLKEKENDIILIRKAELCERPLKLYTLETGKFYHDPPWVGGKNLNYYDKESKIWSNLGYYNKIYDTNRLEVIY